MKKETLYGPPPPPISEPSFKMEDHDDFGGPEDFGGEDYPTFTANSDNAFIMRPLVTPEEEEAIKKLYEALPKLKQAPFSYTTGSNDYFPNEPWIQTYSGKRFNPTKPMISAIVIQDIAHALSMQCRFSGHVRDFYSVAQHSVLVSYTCNHEDALWGLLHDASEAYLVDVPRPLKRSGKFDAYLEFEKAMQEAICKRFHLPLAEPPSVKKADQVMLSTEARDLLIHCREDWVQAFNPLPFKIEPLLPNAAEDLFMARFRELTGQSDD